MRRLEIAGIGLSCSIEQPYILRTHPSTQGGGLFKVDDFKACHYGASKIIPLRGDGGDMWSYYTGLGLGTSCKGRGGGSRHDLNQHSDEPKSTSLTLQLPEISCLGTHMSYKGGEGGGVRRPIFRRHSDKSKRLKKTCCGGFTFSASRDLLMSAPSIRRWRL